MKAQYLQPTGTVVLDVIDKPKSGLADLGRGRDILVKGVPVSTELKMGSCLLLEEEDPKKTADEPKPEEGASKAGQPAEMDSK